jgi:hypothetical protein
MVGGDITVKSESGKGSTFSMRVPATLPGTAAEPAPVRCSEEPASELSADRPLVLLIDDDLTVHDLVRRFLHKEGFRTVCAPSGQEGLELARTLQPSVIVLDVMMPTMDGWSVLTRVKGDPALASIPVVMLTMVDNKEMGFSLGVDDYMLKPIERGSFVSTLRKYGSPHASTSVLVVEDDAATRELLRTSLEKDGISVVEACNGMEAIRKLATIRPALILLDLMMPEMDGFQFTREVRSRPEWSEIPIIVMTAKDIAADDRSQLDGRVSRILQKGACGREELLAEISSRIARATRPVPASTEIQPALVS